MTLNSPIMVLLPRTPVTSSLGPLSPNSYISYLKSWFSVLYVGCVSRHFCWRVGVPRPLCYPLSGFRCCMWGVCHVTSVGVCVSPVWAFVWLLVSTRGVFHVTIVGVCVSPVHCFSSYMVFIFTWGGNYFLISLRSTLLSPYYNFTITSNILTYCYLVKYLGGHQLLFTIITTSLQNFPFLTTMLPTHARL